MRPAIITPANHQSNSSLVYFLEQYNLPHKQSFHLDYDDEFATPLRPSPMNFGFDRGTLDQTNKKFSNVKANYKNRNCKAQDYRLNIDLTFTGHSHMEKFSDWLASIENFFDYTKIPKEKKVKLVAYKLKSGALVWWEHTNNERRLRSKAPINSWERMKKMIV